MPAARTGVLEISYEIGGPANGAPLMLLHGWPDDVRGWRRSAEFLQVRGWRTVTPYLRGFGPTHFLADAAIRDGRGVALAQDAIDLADALGLQTFAVAGHDWGARAAYTLAALFPQRIRAIAGIALAYQPGGAFNLPPFSQARRFWYQWFLALDGGPGALRADPKGFARMQEEVLLDVDAYTEKVARTYRRMPGPEVLSRLNRARTSLVEEVRGRTTHERVPWFGPSMSLASAVTSRIMETWAHGQDVFDALGAQRRPTQALRHVAFLGHRALANSFAAHGLPVPETDVRVELEAPNGEVWEFGDPTAPDIVWGTAEDFCLVVTQRRHMADTTLTAVGSIASKWLTIAQAYAGPPGPGRRPGQFTG